jgi:fructokinase
MNYLQKYNEGQTALAMAFLDENKNAKYEFYKSYPEKRMQQNIPEFQSGDYLLFGSFYSLTPEVRHYLSSVLEKATEAGCLIIYDPNFRKANKNKLTDVLPMLYSNLTHAHIVRGSDEDFQALFDLNSAQKVFAKLSDVLNILIYTQSSESVELISSTIYRKMNVKPIQPISTIGAGDTFNAGLCYWLYTHQKNPFNLQQMSSEECSECIETANNFAASVCMSLENYLPMEVANSYKENSLQAKTLGGATK